MLDPDPKKRPTMDDVLNNSWLDGDFSKDELIVWTYIYIFLYKSDINYFKTTFISFRKTDKITTFSKEFNRNTLILGK